MSLYDACVKGIVSVVRYLLENGADIEGFDFTSNTPLIYASRYGKVASREILSPTYHNPNPNTNLNAHPTPNPFP